MSELSQIYTIAKKDFEIWVTLSRAWLNVYTKKKKTTIPLPYNSNII